MPVCPASVRWTVASCLAVAVCSCEAPYRLEGDPNGPTITLIDSTVLRIPERFGVSPRIHPYRLSDGRYIATDQYRFRIIRFDTSGLAVHDFLARPRPEPAVVTPSPGILPGDSLIAVHDWRHEVIRIFHLETGAVRDSAPAEFRHVGNNWSWVGNDVYIGTGFVETPVARWSGTADPPVFMGSMPRLLLESRAMYIRYGGSGVVASDSSIALVLGTEPGMRLLDRDGKLRSGILIPAARRKGTPPGFLDEERKPRPTRWFHTNGSTIGGLYPRADGSLLLHFVDWDQVGSDSSAILSPEKLRGNYRSYLSLVSADRSKLCIDGQLPAPLDRTHFVIARGDTLELLARHDTVSGMVRLTMHRFLVSADDCTWIDAPRWRP